MSVYAYPIEAAKPLVWAKETTFGSTTTNDAGDTFYPLPIYLTRQPFIYLYRKKHWEHCAGSVDPLYFQNGVYEKGQITLEGKLCDFSLLYMLAGATITANQYGYTADTVASGQGTTVITMTANSTITLNALAGLTGYFSGTPTVNYTIASNTATSTQVVKITLTGNSPADANTQTFTINEYSKSYATSTARAAAKPTFRMIQEITNSTAGNSIKNLIVGCQLKSMRIFSRANDFVYAQLVIEFANIGTATTLTSHPAISNYAKAYDDDMVAITHTSNGTSYSADYYDWWLEYDDGAFLDTASGELNPGRVLKGPRTVKAGFNKAVWKKTASFSETNSLVPSAANNRDITFTITRTTTTDTLTFALDNVWELDGKPAGFDHNNYYLAGNHEFIVKGAISGGETGVCTITEVNSLAGTRYA